MDNTTPQPSEAVTERITRQIESYQADIVNHHAQIAILQGQIADLRSALNDRALIGRLHPEVLAQVFLYRVKHWSYEVSKGGLPRRHWTGILHVCRSWRQLALQTPRLWTSFKPTNPSFVLKSLEHSGILPFDVLAPLATPPNDRLVRSFDHIFAHMSRLRSAHIVLGTPLRRLLHEPRWDGLSAPLLEALDLTTDDYDDDLRPFTTMSITSLTSLSLCRGSFSAVNVLVNEQITQLMLQEIRQVSLPELLALIGLLPALTRLSLRSVCEIEWPFSAEGWGTAIPAERLQHLTHLQIFNKTPFSTSFILHHLHIPAQTNVRLFSTDHAWSAECATMTQHITERIFVPLRPPTD